VIYIGKPIAKSIANWISKKAMEKHAGEDIAGQVQRLKRIVSNDVTHDIQDIRQNIENLWKFSHSIDNKLNKELRNMEGRLLKVETKKKWIGFLHQ
ncbi:hypothetical protein LCGC14_1637190, partial [marine sediment metagenome]